MSRQEQRLISAVINTADLSTPVQEGVTPEWFTTYAAEWKWLDGYYRKYRKAPGRKSFTTKFPEFRILKVTDVGFAVEEMREHFGSQQLFSLVNDIMEGLERKEGAPVVMTHAHQGMVRIAAAMDGGRSESNVSHQWDDLYEEVRDRVDKVKQQSGLAGVPTGFPTLDAITNGFDPGEFWIVAARLGVGKTWSLIRMAVAALEAGHLVQYDSLEQSRNQMGYRVHAFLSRLYGKGKVFKASHLRTGNVDPMAFKLYLSNLANEMPGELIINDQSRGKVSALTLAAQIERNEPSILFVDYLGLMSTDRGDWTQLANISGELKGLAMSTGTPIIAAQQLNRSAIMGANSKGKNGPESIAGADAIGQDADGVITVRRRSKHVMEMHLAKYRNGEDNVTWQCYFDPDNGEMYEISEQDAADWMDKDQDSE